jgi:hypothetical protein
MLPITSIKNVVIWCLSKVKRHVCERLIGRLGGLSHDLAPMIGAAPFGDRARRRCRPALAPSRDLCGPLGLAVLGATMKALQ